MRRVLPWASAAIGVAVVGGFLLAGDRREPASSPMAAPEVEADGRVETAAFPETPAPAPAPADKLAEYDGLLSLQSAASEFVQQADRMAATDRGRRAADLNARIDDLEARRMIVGAQGLYLRASIAAAQFPNDPGGRDAAVAALQQRYAGAAPSRAHLDESYRRLKAREQEIVRDANARAFFPNGMSKEEYLRRELDAALREAYSAGDE